MSIESVVAQLRPLRARIDAQQRNQHSWPTKEEELAADYDRYDRRLLKAAAMLGVEAPAGRGRGDTVLDEDDRLQLEQRLVDSGLDVRAPTDDRSST
jgi:hypothetical protein